MATASLYIELDDEIGVLAANEIEIHVDFTYWPGQPQTRWEPGYGPEVRDWSWEFADDDANVPLPMVVHDAIEKYVTYQMLNDPHGWVDSAICNEEF